MTRTDFLLIAPELWVLTMTCVMITAIAMTPGFLRSEAVLDHFGVTEDNWRDAIEKDAHFALSETPLLVGRAIAALAADPPPRTDLDSDYQLTVESAAGVAKYRRVLFVDADPECIIHPDFVFTKGSGGKLERASG